MFLLSSQIAALEENIKTCEEETKDLQSQDEQVLSSLTQPFFRHLTSPPSALCPHIF